MSFESAASQGTQRVITADLLTPSYRVVGKLMVPNTGVIGVLNDPMTSFTEILDAKLARVHMPTKLVDHFEVMRIVKQQVFAVCLGRREDLGPQALARGGFTKFNEYQVHLTSHVYEITGTVEWPGRFDFSGLMVEGTRDFVPLYNANVTAVLIPTLKIDSPVILVNRKHIDLLGLMNQRAKTE